jgi:large subunit ribosomal protein L16
MLKIFDKFHSKFKFKGIFLPKVKRNTLCLVSKDYGKLSYNEVEAAKKILKKLLKKQGLIYIRIFPHLNITKKSLQSRMGRGKGKIDHKICFVVPGSLIFEVFNVSFEKAKKALLLSSLKLSINCKIGFFLDIYF